MIGGLLLKYQLISTITMLTRPEKKNFLVHETFFFLKSVCTKSSTPSKVKGSTPTFQSFVNPWHNEHFIFMKQILYLKSKWNFCCLFSFNIIYYKVITIMIMISNSNWTEWSTIQGVIARVFSKSEREARGRYETTSTITPWIVRHKVQLLINRIYNKFWN